MTCPSRKLECRKRTNWKALPEKRDHRYYFFQFISFINSRVSQIWKTGQKSCMLQLDKVSIPYTNSTVADTNTSSFIICTYKWIFKQYGMCYTIKKNIQVTFKQKACSDLMVMLLKAKYNDITYGRLRLPENCLDIRLTVLKTILRYFGPKQSCEAWKISKQLKFAPGECHMN